MKIPKSKSGFRNSASQIGGIVRHLDKLLTAIKARETGAQEGLRDDLSEIYKSATWMRDDPGLFADFAASKLVAQLPRAPKTPDQSLRALLQLAYAPKLASARYCRLKPLWIGKATIAEVDLDLKEIGSSPKGFRATFEPHSLAAFPINKLQAGAEVGIMIWAKVETPGRILCEILDVPEWPDDVAALHKK